MYSVSGKTFRSAEDRRKAEDMFNKEIKRRLDLRNRVYKVQTDAFTNGNRIADHYLKREANLPIWAIFELLSLGEFGHFVSCLNIGCRAKISKKIGIRPSDDSKMVYFRGLQKCVRFQGVRFFGFFIPSRANLGNQGCY